ncbi:MAG: hypothetical protein ACE5ES_00810 [Candidatus Nanoarchaeia archaeon]
MITEKRLNKRGKIAIGEILLLLMGTIAFVYVISLINVGFVSGIDFSYFYNRQNIPFRTDGQIVQRYYGTPSSGSWAPYPNLNPSDLQGGAFTSINSGGLNSYVLGAPTAGTAEQALAELNQESTLSRTPTPDAAPGFFDQIFPPGSPQQALFHAAAIGGGVALLAGFIFDGENAGTAGFLAGFTGTLAYKFAIGENLGGIGKGFVSTTNQGLALGAGVGILVFILLYKNESQKIVQYTCYPWDAPVGGEHCEACNEQGLPCSEYQCRSLGQACQLLNKEESGEKFCAWVNPGDVEPPIITPWEDALTPDHSYNPDNTISPPDRGVKIVSSLTNDGCVEAFTPLSFGITLDEPGRCKLSYTRVRNFSDMRFYFGGSSTFKLNHTQVMSLPGPSALIAENVTLQNGGNFELFTRCMDANGNTNEANFLFRFCVDDGPDTTPPLIVTTSVLNGFPIAFNQTSLDLTVFVNEPAECRWSERDQRYEDMEHDMSCSTSVTEINAQNLYECQTTLTGLKNRQDNDFYFRCKDQPIGVADADRNTNVESYKYTIVGTQPLFINEVGPNGTIKDSTSPIKVTLTAETSAGYKEGEATCSYSDTGDEGSFIQFFETNSHTHSQDLFLAEGSYTYHIRCTDLGGNTDNEVVEFEVDSDTQAPTVVRVFHEENLLTIITNEPASCVYDTADCNYLFDDGITMSVFNENEHSTDWNVNTNFYIKCRDEFGNQPNPNECSLTVRPLEIEFQR